MTAAVSIAAPPLVACAAVCRAAYDPAVPPDHQAGGAEVYLRHTDGWIVVGMRGTTPGWDIAADIRAWPEYAPELGCRVHRGFLAAARSVASFVLPLLRHSRVVLTGHSKGGAEATILAALACAWGWPRPPGALVTFGAPRAGFSGLARCLADVPVARIVRPGDLVPLVPRLLPWRHPAEAIEMPGPRRWPMAAHSMAAYEADVIAWERERERRARSLVS
ncbi:MAG: lipase family protein [Alphaproteobacteria bacterium]|nr:lipase family protein [Alphaproteobacteria bacterium]